MEDNSVIWSDKALSDLDSILEYISQNAGEEYADYVLKGIEETVSRIYPFPHKHVREPLLNDYNIRYAVKWKYKIIYEIFSNHVEILHIYHTARDISTLLG
ncbi:hypothetical protein FACS189440_08870 [Bacteroidia bacterium]|nr:hypothetical protein FACS189440_08870 [Bacteroidia bacterium]